jgi:hypothetical protein
LGDWELKEEGLELESITLTWSKWEDVETGNDSNIISSWNNFVTMIWGNIDSRWGVYKYGEVDEIETFFDDVDNEEIDYKVTLFLSWANLEEQWNIFYELLFWDNNNNWLVYTANSKKYYHDCPITKVEEHYFDWVKWENVTNSSINLNYDRIPMEFDREDWWRYIYRFYKPQIKNNNWITKLEFYLKEEFWNIDFTKEILKELSDIRFYINKTFPNKNNNKTSVTISNFKITKVKKSLSTIKSSDFELVAYAPYNQVGDLNLYNSGSNIYWSLSSTWILNWTNWTEKSREICDEKTSDQAKGFCQIWWIKWVFIKQPDDSLSYSWVVLNSWSWFVIEMSVRWEDLMRNDLTFYYLFDSNDNKLFLYNLKWNLYLKSFDWIDTKKIEIKINSLEKNKFYKIIAWVKNNKMFLVIPALNYKKIEKYIWWNRDTLYIWVNNDGWTKKEQWNSIIDYIKIYK